MSRSVPELEGHVLMLILLFRGVTLQNLGLGLDLGNWNLEDLGEHVAEIGSEALRAAKFIAVQLRVNAVSKDEEVQTQL
jgi:hypothetical protein